MLAFTAGVFCLCGFVFEPRVPKGVTVDGIDVGGMAKSTAAEILRAGTIENLRKTGRIYYLEAPADVLYERIKDDTKRPLLMTKDPKKTLKEILDKRRIKYECADFKINTANKTAKEIVDEIVEIYEKING